MTKAAEAEYVPRTPVFLLILRAACSREVFAYDRNRARCKSAIACRCAARNVGCCNARTSSARHTRGRCFIVLRYKSMARSIRSSICKRSGATCDGTFAAGTFGAAASDRRKLRAQTRKKERAADARHRSDRLQFSHRAGATRGSASAFDGSGIRACAARRDCAGLAPSFDGSVDL